MIRHTLSLSLLALTLSCASLPASAVDESQPAHAVEKAGPATSGVSLYDLKAELTDQEGKAVGLDVFKGHPTVISMFYANCAYVCPALITKVQDFESHLTDAERNDLRVLLVSFDPERDTPDVLMSKVEKHGVDGERWKLARADEGKVREIAALLGFLYRRLPDGNYNHSTVVTLLDRTGVPVARIEELGDSDEPLVKALRGLPK